MTLDSLETLTDRQIAIVEAISRGLTIKEICHEQSVSESSVNKHIRQIKEKLGAQSRSEIVAAHQKHGNPQFNEGCSFSAPSFSELPSPPIAGPEATSDMQVNLMFEDSQEMRLPASWTPRSQPRIVPRWLNGQHALLVRLGLIGGLAVGLMILMIVALAATSSLSDLVSSSDPNLALERQ